MESDFFLKRNQENEFDTLQFFPVLYKIFPSPSVYVYKSILMFLVNLLTGFSKWKMAGGWAGGYNHK